jgi:hypothetical protein
MTTEPIPPQSDEEVAPSTEEVHLPEPSYLPAWTAFGITVMLVGILLSWVIFGIGAAVALFAIVKWIRQAREEISDLPLER